MHRQPDLDTTLDLDDDLDLDFVFDLQSLELFDTAPVTRPADEEPGQEHDLAVGGIAERFARLAGWSPRLRA